MILSKKNLKFFLDSTQKDELKKAFDLLDEEGIGTIDSDDIFIVIRALAINVKPVNISKLLKRFDPQHKGTLDFRAFLCIMELLIFNQFTDDEIRKSFEIYCQHGSKALQFEDLKRVARQLNENICEEDLQV
nr:centrin 2 [Hymenolepis microstoma]